MATYDPKNVFAKMLRGEIPCQKIAENEHALAFHDHRPQAPIHVLVIPKGDFTNYIDFAAKATNEEMFSFWRLVGDVAKKVGATEGGYRLIVNNGVNAFQEVMHFHVHILGGRILGGMLPSFDPYEQTGHR
ncbi:MAG: HIT domain-containing protein [Proteobacteria bacterium]|nr:HIT domain-containing protein [Pseudomonadota bacterium]